MARPREHDERTAAALVGAAESLLQERGNPEAITVRAVALRVDVSVRAVYSLFGDRGGLIGALVNRAFVELAEGLFRVARTGDPGADLIAVGIDGFRQFAIKRPHLYRLTFEGTLHCPPTSEPAPWAQGSERAGAALRGRVGEFLASHPSVEASTRDVAAQFHAICQGLASCEINGVFAEMGIVEPLPLWHDALSGFLNGIQAPAGPAERGGQPGARRRRSSTATASPTINAISSPSDSTTGRSPT